MLKQIWRIAIFADGIVTFFFISQFDVDDQFLPYVGALIGIVVLLLMLAGGWQWIMEIQEKEELLEDDTEILEFEPKKRK